MEQEIFITGYKSYNFTDNDGNTRSGVKITYLPSSNSKGEGEVGWLPIQSSLNVSFLGLLKGAGIYKTKVNLVSGAGNKPKLEIVSIDFVKSVDISKLF